jgi:hypothetical protein
VIISSANGVNALQKGMDILKNGSTRWTLVPAVTLLKTVNDDSVGYGGLPNEEESWNWTPA